MMAESSPCLPTSCRAALAFSTLCKDLKTARSAANWMAFFLLVWIGEEIARFNTNKINGLLTFFLLLVLFCCKGFCTYCLLESIKNEHLGQLQEKISNIVKAGWACILLSLLLVVITLLASDTKIVDTWLWIFLMQFITFCGFLYMAFKIDLFLEEQIRVQQENTVAATNAATNEDGEA